MYINEIKNVFERPLNDWIVAKEKKNRICVNIRRVFEMSKNMPE